MGGGLAFLTKKSFNPANWSNQKQVWEARQKDGIEKRRVAERDAQLRREREEEELARAVGGEEGGGRKALSFMYDAGRVPGLERKRGDGDCDDGGFVDGEGRRHNREGEEEEEEMDVEAGRRRRRDEGDEGPSLYERQPGDDDAAAAFREMLARGTTADESSSSSAAAAASGAPRPTTEGGADANAAEARDRGDHRTNLEKAVGRGINATSGVTLAQQIERFPMLKGAPRVFQKPAPASSSGDGADGKESSSNENDVVGLNFKPLGQVLRNVKCVKCGEWGHTMGDRECKLTGWDPFASVSTQPTAAPRPRPPPAAAAAAAAAAAISAAMTSGVIGKASHESKNSLAEMGEGGEDDEVGDDRRRRKEKRHRKDERKRHAKDEKRRSRHKRHASKRRRDRSPSYHSSSESSPSYYSSDEDGYDSRDRRSRKHGEDRYRTSRRHRRRHHHRHDKSSDDGSSSVDRRHRSREESGLSRRDEKPSTSRRMLKRRRSRSRSRSKSES